MEKQNIIQIIYRIYQMCDIAWITHVLDSVFTRTTWDTTQNCNSFETGFERPVKWSPRWAPSIKFEFNYVFMLRLTCGTAVVSYHEKAFGIFNIQNQHPSLSAHLIHLQVKLILRERYHQACLSWFGRGNFQINVVAMYSMYIDDRNWKRWSGLTGMYTFGEMCMLSIPLSSHTIMIYVNIKRNIYGTCAVHRFMFQQAPHQL